MRRCIGLEPGIAPDGDNGELVREQFLAFYDRAIGPLHGYLFRASGGQREVADDLCRDVFAMVLRRHNDPVRSRGSTRGRAIETATRRAPDAGSVVETAGQLRFDRTALSSRADFSRTAGRRVLAGTTRHLVRA